MLKRKKKKKKYTTQTKEKIPLHSTVQHAQARTPKSHLLQMKREFEGEQGGGENHILNCATQEKLQPTLIALT